MPNPPRDFNKFVADLHLKQDIELFNLRTENMKLKLKIENDEKAYMSLLRDYTEIKEENEKHKKDIKKAIELLDWFIS